MSTPFEMFSMVSPRIKEETLQEISTTSIPLVTSPIESAKTFPCSSVIDLANLS